MSVLPDELWRLIMEIGVETKTLDFKSLCCLSVVSRRFRLLAADDSLWFHLLLSDFPSPINRLNSGDGDKKPGIGGRISASSGGKVKRTYRIRYERDREIKLLAHRRDVLKIESAKFFRKIREMRMKFQLEVKRLGMEKKRNKTKRR